MLPEAVFLACRHLDETEGPVHAGRVLEQADRAAINTVLAYLARLHQVAADQTEQAFLGDLDGWKPTGAQSVLPPQRKLTRAEVDAWLAEHDDPSLRAPLQGKREPATQADVQDTLSLLGRAYVQAGRELARELARLLRG
jgi:hypothetical protein